MEYELSGKFKYTVCAENTTKKRLESQLKTMNFHRIIKIVHKTMFHPHQNFNPYHYFWPVPKLCKPAHLTRPLPKFDSRHPQTCVPTLPTAHTLFSRLVKLIIWTAITMEFKQWNLQRNFTRDIFLNIFEIFRTCSGWWLPNLSKQTKSIHKVGNILKNIAATDVNLMFLL